MHKLYLLYLMECVKHALNILGVSVHLGALFVIRECYEMRHKRPTRRAEDPKRPTKTQNELQTPSSSQGHKSRYGHIQQYIQAYIAIYPYIGPSLLSAEPGCYIYIYIINPGLLSAKEPKRRRQLRQNRKGLGAPETDKQCQFQI